jgi:hypothetical protein
MAKTQSPLLGYNTNVRHKGKVFHIQTEDSGVAKPHVITHLFADGGRVIKSVKTSYADRLEAADLPVLVKKLMQDQHKAMFIALRDGLYDDPLEATIRAPALFEDDVTERPRAPSEPSRDTLADTLHETPAVTVMEADDSIELDESSFVDDAAMPTRLPPPPLASPIVPPPQPSRTGGRQSGGWAAASSRTTPPFGATLGAPPPLRPPGGREAAAAAAALGQTAIAATTTAANTIPVARPDKRTPMPTPRVTAMFGERLVSERSLDDVILSYLAEELGEKPRP